MKQSTESRLPRLTTGRITRLVCKRILLPGVLTFYLASIALWISPSIGSPQILAQESTTNIFLPAPRILKQHLSRAQRAIAEEQYSDAVSHLGTILTQEFESPEGEQVDPDALPNDENQDYFVETIDAPGSYVSLKGEAQRLLGSLPPAALQLYELQYGSDATRILNESLEQGSLDDLTTITRKYFHTQAGYEAAILLAYRDRDHGRPLAAALNFKRVYDAPAARRKYDPELSLVLATCWLHAQIPSKAAETLHTLKQELPGSKFEIGGKQYDIFTSTDDPLTWLNNLAGQGEIVSLNDNIQWVLFRGSPERNASSRGGRPLPSLRWTVPTGTDKSDENYLKSMIQGAVLQNKQAISTVQPLVVRDTVLTRTPRQLIAIDFRTGKRLWEFPWFETEDQQTLLQASTQNTEGASTVRQQELRQRLMQDHAYGQLSSDGERVFLLWDLPLVQQNTRRNVPVFNPATGKSTGADSNNQLAALDLETEGSLSWVVGGDTGEDEPALAGAFFLGPPLPLYDRLYTIAELNGEIRLCVLDAATGALQWQQQLAHVDNRVITLDSKRRLAGATPSFADGVLICPTSAGAIVAVDISSRTLLWGYTYRNLNLGSSNPFQANPFGTSSQRSQQWIDSTVTIVDGSVIATPVENNTLICLDLLTGKPRWKPLERTGDLFIGCVQNGKIIIVGNQQISAIELQTGENIWKQTGTISPGVINGRGFISDQTYFVPTSDHRLLEIQTENGELVTTTELGEKLGNLICHEDQIISQTPDALTVFYQLEPLQKKVAARLAEDNKDVWALSRQCELLVEQGQYDAALESLRSTARLAPNDLVIQQLTIRTMLILMRADFATYENLGDEIQNLDLTSVQFESFLQAKAEGQRKTGQVTASFETYLELIAHSSKLDSTNTDINPELRLTSEGVHVRIDRWVQGQLVSLLESANAQQRMDIELRIEEHLKRAVAQSDVLQLRDFSRFFGTHSLAEQARLELAIALIETQAGYASEMLEAEMLLVHLQNHAANPQVQQTSMVYLSRLLTMSGHYQQAANVYREIAARWPDNTVFENISGSQLLQQTFEQAEFEPYRSASPPWNQGFTSVSKTTDTEGRFPSYQRIYNIQLREVEGPWIRGTQVGYDQQKNALTLRDNNGNITQEISLHRGRQVFGTQYQVAYAKVMGHYLYAFVGREMLAIDLLSASSDPSEAILWRRSILGTNQTTSTPIPLRSRVSTTPWGTRRYNAIDSSGNRIGLSGSISLLGIVFQNQEDLYCVDPLTGETIWVRNGIPVGSEIFTENETIIVISSKTKESYQFSLIDGSLMEQRDDVSIMERWKVSGFHALVYRIEGTNITLGLQNVATDEMVWQYSYPTGIRGQLMRDQLAIMQPNGKFEIRNLLDGKIIVQQQLKPEPQISNLYVVPYQDRFLVIPNRSMSSRGISLPSVGMQTKLINGSIYCIDKETGDFLWQTPATVETWGLPLAQSPNSPVLAFIRQLNPTSTQNRTQGSIRSELFCIDKRDGRMLMPPREIPGYIRIFSVIAEPAENKVMVVADKNHIYEFKLTDEPTFPAAPVRMQANRGALGSESLNHFTRGFFDAFGAAGKVIEQKNARDAEKKEQAKPAIPKNRIPAKQIQPQQRLPVKPLPIRAIPAKPLPVKGVPNKPNAPKNVPAKLPQPQQDDS